MSHNEIHQIDVTYHMASIRHNRQMSHNDGVHRRSPGEVLVNMVGVLMQMESIRMHGGRDGEALWYLGGGGAGMGVLVGSTGAYDLSSKHVNLVHKHDGLM